MKKLFDHIPASNISLEVIKPAKELEVPYPSEKDFKALESCITGYCNASELYDSVANESYALVDAKNRALFNAYAQLLSERLGVSMPSIKQVSLESIQSEHPVVINKEIALEGWIGTLWEKIKGFFNKMYEGIKAFFARHFTRLGKTKKSLENMKTLLEKTDKNIKEPAVENYSGPLLKLYSGYGQVNATAIKQSVSNVDKFTKGLTSINQQAKVFADKFLVDKDFFSRIKALQERAKAADTVKTGIDKDTPARRLFDNKERAAKIKESKSLGEIASKSQAQADAMDDKASKLALSGEGTEESNNAKAKEAMKSFLEEVKNTVSVVLDSKLIGGVVIKSINFSEDLDLTIEVGEENEEATGVYLGAKSDLLTVTKQALEMIKVAEGSTEFFVKINDSIMKNLGTIDNLVSDIDRIDPAKYGNYKKLINEQVRERLNLLRKFFSSYNKVGKNIFEYNMQCCEGVVHYCVLSVKHFG